MKKTTVMLTYTILLDCNIVPPSLHFPAVVANGVYSSQQQPQDQSY
jgi:hypothetical protein